MVDKGKIVIISTVVNKDLYNISAKCHPKGIKRIVIDGSTGMYGINSLFFMFNKLNNTNYDWVIMADEDVFFTCPNEIFEIVDFMDENNYAICGVRDGGEINHRNFNPHVVNTFFSVLNLKKIKKYLNKSEILKNQYPIKSNEKAFSILKYAYDIDSLYEAYYCLYFYLIRKGLKFLYLKAVSPYLDSITNAVLTPSSKTLLIHTWHARDFNKSEKHTQRIYNIIKNIEINDNQEIDYEVWRDNLFLVKKKIDMIKKKIKRVFNQFSIILLSIL